MNQERRHDKAFIRRAALHEAALLTDLALRSKAHWGYDAEFIADCRADLTLTPEYLGSHQVFVVEEQGIVTGFYSLERQAEADVELVHLFVEPCAIGAGYGKRLWLHAVETARGLGFQEIVISSDPFAESFYLAMGARRVGQVASAVREGRYLPLLRYRLPLSSASVM